MAVDAVAVDGEQDRDAVPGPGGDLGGVPAVPATEVARRAGNGVAVLLKIYAHCIDGQATAANQRITEALGTQDDAEDPGDEDDADTEQVPDMAGQGWNLGLGSRHAAPADGPRTAPPALSLSLSAWPLLAQRPDAPPHRPRRAPHGHARRAL